MARLTAAVLPPDLVLALPAVERQGRQAPRLDHPTLAGRLTELSGVGATAALTLAFTVVQEIQLRGEPVAWVMSGEQLFYPPDVQESGVDCEAVVVVCVP